MSYAAQGSMPLSNKLKRGLGTFPRNCYDEFVKGKRSKLISNLEDAYDRYGYASDFDYIVANYLTDPIRRREKYLRVRKGLFRNYRSKSILANEIMGLAELCSRGIDYIKLTIRAVHIK